MPVEATLPTTYTEYVALCAQLKVYLGNLKTQMEAGAVSGNVIAALHERVIRDGDQLLAYSQVSGIGNYVAGIQGKTAQQVADEFNALIAELTDIRDYLVLNNITLGTGWLTFSNSGVSTKTFSTAATSELRGHIQASIDQIS